MITFFYTTGIHLYVALIRLAALWSPKARQWIAGRRQVWRQIADFNQKKTGTGATIWIHCASLGEFEQGRPLIEALKARHPATRLVLTFFSPSGYEIRKHYASADLVCYLPADTPANSRRFAAAVRPDLAVFVKYEFWHHHLQALRQAKVPVLLISAIFRPRQIFFRPYGGWYRRLLHDFQHLFVQDERSAELLTTIGVRHCSLAGDTRVDRVLQLREQAPDFTIIADFAGAAPVWVAGSTWPPDEALLFSFWDQYLPPHWKIIIAPHDIAEDHIRQIEQHCPLPCRRYSRLPEGAPPSDNCRVLIIDNIGMLSALYRYGRIAYIGGGFGKAIHNLLEPIAFRLPVLFGPRHEKFQEALALKASGGGFAIETAEDLKEAFVRLQDDEQYRIAARSAFGYLEASRGSTDKILSYIEKQFADRFHP